MPTRSTPALDTMRTITGVGESDRSMFPVTTACAAAAPESNGRTSTSTSCFLKNPSSLATYATSPENTGGTPGTAIVTLSAPDAPGAATATRMAVSTLRPATRLVRMGSLRTVLFQYARTCGRRAERGRTRVHAQIEVFLWGLKKAETISIACARGLYVGRPDDPTVGMTSENAWNGGRYPQTRHVPAVQSRGPDLSPRAGDCTSGAHARPQTDRAPEAACVVHRDRAETLLEPVALRIREHDGCREHQGHVLPGLLRQSLQPVEPPEVAVLLAVRAQIVQLAAQLALPVIVAGQGEHERLRAVLGQEVREIARSGPGGLLHVEPLVDFSIHA